VLFGLFIISENAQAHVFMAKQCNDSFNKEDRALYVSTFPLTRKLQFAGVNSRFVGFCFHHLFPSTNATAPDNTKAKAPAIT